VPRETAIITGTFRVAPRREKVRAHVAGRSLESQPPESRRGPGMFRGGPVLSGVAVVATSTGLRSGQENWCKAGERVPSRVARQP